MPPSRLNRGGEPSDLRQYHTPLVIGCAADIIVGSYQSRHAPGWSDDGDLVDGGRLYMSQHRRDDGGEQDYATLARTHSLSWLLGSAPTLVASGLPSLNRIMVGMPRTA